MQTRILAVAAAVTLCLAAVLIVMSSQPSRRSTPPERTETEGTSASVPHDTKETRDEPADQTEVVPPTPETETSAPTSPTPQESDAAPVAAEPVPDALPDFISPVTGVVSQHHSTDVPVYSITMADYRTHTGVDIACPDGTTVRAAADGTIREVWTDPLMGQCLSVDHAGGARSIYKNLSPELLAGIVPGKTVKAGEALGTVGDSALIEIGLATHLHYELEIGGVPVDPADFMLIGTEDVGFEG